MTSGQGRSAEDVQREIEQARVELAATVDQLAERTSPKRLVADLKQRVLSELRSPRGKIVVGATAAVVALLLVRRVRTVRRKD